MVTASRLARVAILMVVLSASFVRIAATCSTANLIQGCAGPCQYITVNGSAPSGAVTGNFWGLGGGNPVLGLGDDNGAVLARGNTDSDLDWVKSYEGSFYLAGSWGNSFVDNCIMNNTTPSPKRTVVLLADATAREGVFAALCSEADLGGNFDYYHLGTATMAPIPAPAVTRTSVLSGNSIEVELSSPPLQEVAAGLYLDSSCPSNAVVTGYKTFFVTLPIGDPPPSSRSPTSGWTLTGEPTSLGASTVFTAMCGVDCALYVATSLVFDGGFESAYLSKNVCVTGVDANSNDIIDGCDDALLGDAPTTGGSVSQPGDAAGAEDSTEGPVGSVNDEMDTPMDAPSSATGFGTATGVFISDPLPVNTTATSDHQGPYPVSDMWPDIATDGQGTWLVVWSQTSGDPSLSDRIVLSRSTDFGTTWTAPLLISDNAYAGPSPRVTTDRQGVWGVTWAQSGWTVVFERSTDNGASWSSPVRLDPAQTVQRYPNLAADALGNWNAVWEVNDEVIVAARSTDGGLTWGAPGQLGNSLPGQSRSPSIAMAGNGAMIALWECIACLGQTDRDLRFARGFFGECSVTAKACATETADTDCPDTESCVLSGGVDCSTVPPGTPCCPGDIEDGFCWVAPDWLESTATSEEDFDFNPDVATDGHGTWIAVWWSDPASPIGLGVSSIMASRSTDDGRTWSPAAAITTWDAGTNGNGWRSQPAVATDGRGRWAVVWDSIVDPFGNVGQETDIYFSRSEDNGQTWTTREPFNTNAADDHPTAGWDDGPRIAADGTGRWMGVWSSEEDFNGTLGNPPWQYRPDGDILYARFTLSEIELVEPEPFLLNGPDLTTDELKLLVFGKPRWGLAADGVTRLLVRLPVPGPGAVEFSIADELGGTSGVGALYAPGSTAETTTLAVAVSEPLPGRYVAFAVLRAPEDFVRLPSDEPLESRPIQLTAQYFPVGGGSPVTYVREVRLVRPPVMLLHGLWSDRTTWGNEDEGQPWSLTTDQRFTVYRHDYSSTHAEEFDVNVPEVRKGIDQAVEFLRGTGVATTQVDVVGHSMGGILARLYAANTSGDYIRDTNYGAGDINRLISLDTPHWGSPLANTILDIAVAEFLANLLGCVNCGAVDNLRCDSPEIAALPAASLPAHAMAADGGSDAQLVLESGLLETRLYHLLLFRGIDLPSVFLPEAFHDVIVGLNSERGGLSGGQTSLFDWSSAVEKGIHWTVTNEPRVSDRVIVLLNTPVTQPVTYASGFSANVGVPPTCPYPGTAPGPLSVTTTGGIAITQPVPGTSVSPGQSISVTVDGFGGYVPDHVLITDGDDSVIVDAAPFTATLSVSLVRTAPMEVSAMAVDAGGVYAVASPVQLQTIQSASLRDIFVDNSPLVLTSYAPEGQLLVSGFYDDGLTRNITASPMGTSYTSQNPSIATVDSEGRVTARSLGTVAIDVSNSGLFDYAIVVVASLPLTLRMSPAGPTWPAWGGAVGYDLVRGSLDVLRSTGGDFSVATDACLADNSPDTAFEESAVPNQAQAFWYLVRIVYSDAGARGSYDDVGTGTNRDTGIASSPNACP